MRSRYRIYEASRPHFLTCSIVRWLPVFAFPDAAKIVLESWQFLQNARRMTLFGYVIMENHLHFIASSPDLRKEVGDFKSFTARQIIDWLKRRGSRTTLRMLKRLKARHKTDREYQLWQEGSHPKLIDGGDMMRQKLEYMHYNAVKRGYVDEPTHWRYSSARNYAGMRGCCQ